VIPPEIPISDIDIPIAMFVGKYDTLATPWDNRENKDKIKNLVLYEELELDHLSFMMGKDMTYFKSVLDVLNQYNDHWIIGFE